MSNKKRTFIMSGIVSTYRKLLEFPLSVLVKNNPIPAQPIEELQLNINQPCLLYTSCTLSLILTVILCECTILLATFFYGCSTFDGRVAYGKCT